MRHSRGCGKNRAFFNGRGCAVDSLSRESESHRFGQLVQNRAPGAGRSIGELCHFTSRLIEELLHPQLKSEQLKNVKAIVFTPREVAIDQIAHSTRVKDAAISNSFF